MLLCLLTNFSTLKERQVRAREQHRLESNNLDVMLGPEIFVFLDLLVGYVGWVFPYFGWGDFNVMNTKILERLGNFRIFGGRPGDVTNGNIHYAAPCSATKLLISSSDCCLL